VAAFLHLEHIDGAGVHAQRELLQRAKRLIPRLTTMDVRTIGQMQPVRQLHTGIEQELSHHAKRKFR